MESKKNENSEGEGLDSLFYGFYGRFLAIGLLIC